MKVVFYSLILLLFSHFISAQNVYNFQLETPEGIIIEYNASKGEKLTILDFWATWCKPCVNSIPKLVELAATFTGEQVKFIAISIDGPRNISKIRPFAESVGINYPVMLDINQEISHDLNISIIPTLLIVGANDEILFRHEGFALGDEKILKSEIDRLLHE